MLYTCTSKHTDHYYWGAFWKVVLSNLKMNHFVFLLRKKDEIPSTTQTTRRPEWNQNQLYLHMWPKHATVEALVCLGDQTYRSWTCAINFCFMCFILKMNECIPWSLWWQCNLVRGPQQIFTCVGWHLHEVNLSSHASTIQDSQTTSHVNFSYKFTNRNFNEIGLFNCSTTEEA